jgi:hypothetical protein
MSFFSGLFQMLAVVFCTAAIAMQIAAVATGWIYFSWTFEGIKVHREVGLFEYCQYISNTDDSITYRCDSMTGSEGLGFDQEKTLCFEDYSKPMDQRKLTNSLLPAIRGAEALGIITVLASIGSLAVVLLFVCDKIKTAIPAFFSSSFAAAGAIGTFIVFYSEINGACPSSFCDEASKFLSGVEGFHCVAAYGVYLSWGSVLCLFGSVVTLCLVNRARRIAAEKAMSQAQTQLMEVKGISME